MAVQPRRSSADTYAATFARLNLSSLLNTKADEEEEEEGEVAADLADTPPPRYNE